MKTYFLLLNLEINFESSPVVVIMKVRRAHEVGDFSAFGILGDSWPQPQGSGNNRVQIAHFTGEDTVAETCGAHCRPAGRAPDSPTLALGKLWLVSRSGCNKRGACPNCGRCTAAVPNTVHFLLHLKNKPHTKNIPAVGVKEVISHFTKWSKLRQASLVPSGSGVSPSPASAPVSHLKLIQPPSTTESQTCDLFKVKYVWKLAERAMKLVGQPVATLRYRLEMKGLLAGGYEET